MKVVAAVAAATGTFSFTGLSATITKERAYSLVGAAEWLAVLSLVFTCYTVSWDLDAKSVRIRCSFTQADDVDNPSHP